MVEEDDDLQIWRVTAKMMKKQSWTADEGVALHVGNWPDGYQLNALQKVTQTLRRGQIL